MNTFAVALVLWVTFFGDASHKTPLHTIPMQDMAKCNTALQRIKTEGKNINGICVQIRTEIDVKRGAIPRVVF